MTGSVTDDDARARFAAARVARLATVGASGAPHLVPIVFALAGDDLVYSAVDAKPKRHGRLRRLANIAHESRVSLLADHYEEDWTQLWWVRADGRARVLPDAPEALAALAGKYPQYRRTPPPGPFLVIEVGRWSAWTGGPADH